MRLRAHWQVDPIALVNHRNKDLALQTMQALIELQTELASLPELPEIEWTRLRAIEFQEMLRNRIALTDRIVKLECQHCPDFDKHVRVHFHNYDDCWEKAC